MLKGIAVFSFAAVLMLGVSAATAQVDPQAQKPAVGEQLTLEKVNEYFKNALHKSKIVDDIVVIDKAPINVLVALDPPKKLMQFILVFGFVDGTPLQDKLVLANKLNVQLVVSRFYITDDGLMRADYYISYEDGLAPPNIIRAYDWVYRTVTEGISQHDTAKIVK